MSYCFPCRSIPKIAVDHTAVDGGVHCEEAVGVSNATSSPDLLTKAKHHILMLCLQAVMERILSACQIDFYFVLNQRSLTCIYPTFIFANP